MLNFMIFLHEYEGLESFLSYDDHAILINCTAVVGSLAQHRGS